MKVKVTQSDIDNGNPMNSFACPIALAITRELQDESHGDSRWGYAEVEPTFVWIDSQTKEGPLPESVQTFISLFDDGYQNLKPFEFNIYFKEIECVFK